MDPNIDFSRFENRFVKFEHLDLVRLALLTAPRGKPILYHTGFLAKDTEHKVVPKKEEKELYSLLRLIRSAYDEGEIELVQKKRMPYTYEYYAIRRRKRARAPEHFYPNGLQSPLPQFV